MPHKIASCRHGLQINSDETYVNSRHCRGLEGRFTKRIVGLARFIPKDYLRDTYLTMLETMSLETRTSFAYVVALAERRGVSVRTLQRHCAELVALSVVVVTERRYGMRSNHSNRYTFPLLNEEFLRCRGVSPRGVKRVTVKPLPEIKKHTTTPRAPEARRGINHTWTPDPERPQPQRPTFAAWRSMVDRCRNRPSATVGMYAGETQPDMSHAEMETLRRGIAEKEALWKARLRGGV